MRVQYLMNVWNHYAVYTVWTDLDGVRGPGYARRPYESEWLVPGTVDQED